MHPASSVAAAGADYRAGRRFISLRTSTMRLPVYQSRPGATAICDQNGFAHGATVFPMVTCTWNFDGVGDCEAASYCLTRPDNGGRALLGKK
jgi:hypothetical protein